jgi:hypothetical protein
MRSIEDIIAEKLKVSSNEKIINDLYKYYGKPTDYIRIFKNDEFNNMFKWDIIESYLKGSYPDLLQEYVPIANWYKTDQYLRDRYNTLLHINLLLGLFMSFQIKDNNITHEKVSLEEQLKEFAYKFQYDIINSIDNNFGLYTINCWDDDGSVFNIYLDRK